VLYRVNPTNGALAEVSSGFSAGYYDLGSTTAGLFAVGSDGFLYAGGTPIGLTIKGNSMSSGGSTLYIGSGGNLYTVNTTTGAATFLGGSGGGVYDSLVVEVGILYGDATNGNIYTLNMSNGDATFLSNVSGTSSSFWGLAPCDSCAPPAVTPLPAALPLFATGLGALGWFGRRSKRKGADAIGAA
jgi:hypothetical protein